MYYLSLPALFGSLSQGQHWDQVFNPEVVETDQGIEITLALPGFERGNISLVRENYNLSITAERQIKTKHGDENRTIARRFAIPKHINLEDIDAEYKDGVLTIKAMRAEESKPVRIEIR